MLTHVEGYEWSGDKLVEVNRNVGGWMNTTSAHFCLSQDGQEMIGVFDTGDTTIQVNHDFLTPGKRRVRHIHWKGESMHFWEQAEHGELPRKLAVITVSRRPDPHANNENVRQMTML